jgi:hypothetical protein
MYQPMLFIHWKQASWPLLPISVAAFGLPLLSVQGMGGDVGEGGLFAAAYSPLAVIGLPLYPILAFLAGAALALTSWNWDHQQNHVYALSLPLARWEYAMLKMGAGAVLALIPVTALWLGAHIASVSVTLPVGLSAYPNELGARFLLAVALSYTLFFAMAAGTMRTNLWIVSAAISALVIGVPILVSLGFADAALQLLWRPGGPFEVFTGNWALIDV